MRGRSFKRHTQHNQHVQHVVHADGHITSHQQQTVSYQAPQSAAMQRKRFLIVVVIALIVVAGVLGIRAIVGRDVKNNPAQTATPTAVTQLVSQSLNQLAAETPTGLSGVVDTINATDGGTSDPSLLYIKLRYYVAVGDVANSRKTYDALAKIYNPKVGYDPLINDSARDLTSLKKDVEFLEQQSAQVTKNAWGNSNE